MLSLERIWSVFLEQKGGGFHDNIDGIMAPITALNTSNLFVQIWCIVVIHVSHYLSDFHRFDLIVSPPIAQINEEWDDLEKSNA